jgi:hypothetical protein
MAIVKLNANAYESGEAYLSSLQDEVERNFAILLSLLSSYWKSTVDGPNYARSIKAMATAISQIRVSLGDVFNDSEYAATRGEFINQVVTSLVFPKEAPDLDSSDIDFRHFLVSVIPLYFRGSVPSSIRDGVELLTKGKVVVYAMYEEARKPGSGFDISDEFSFGVDVLLDSPGQTNMFLSDRNVRILLQIIRPAHTLYRLRFILRDEYLGHQTKPVQGHPYQPNKVLDAPAADLANYSYDDFRKFVLGVKDVDPYGFKTPKYVTAENHDADFLPRPVAPGDGASVRVPVRPCRSQEYSEEAPELSAA